MTRSPWTQPSGVTDSLIGCHARAERWGATGLDGTWTNELGSTLVIDPVVGGAVTGSYTTAVSDEACAQGEFAVAGRTDVDSGGQSVAWTVSWTNEQSRCNSVTAWSGQYDPDDDVITTFWLLSRQTPPDQDWASTNVGVDEFLRAGAEDARRATKAIAAPAHP